MNMTFSRLLYLILFLLLLIATSFFIFYKCVTEKNLRSDGTVVIVSGSGFSEISAILKKEGIIINRFTFCVMAKLLQMYQGQTLQAGEYKFDANMSQMDILDKMTHGVVLMHKITIPEGYTTWQIKKLLDGADSIVDSNKAIDFTEGLYLPGTYFYKYGTKDAVLLQKMRQAMSDLIDEAWEKADDFAKAIIKDKYNAIILASIVEREGTVDDERPRIARVYMNRMEKNMLLQADPTVIYGITMGKKVFARRVTFNDLKHQSEYNTYKNLGLPPTPICNPGKASILAVLNPTITDELYFVADRSGRHIFSKTFEGHKSNIKKVRVIVK